MIFKTGFYKTTYDTQPEIEYSEMTAEEAKKEFERLDRIHNGGVRFTYLAKSLEHYKLLQYCHS